jgi:hypothetical protein
MKVSPIADADIAAVIDLWRRAGLTRPWNDPGADIAFARSSGHGEVLVGRQDGVIVAAVMVGHDGHRGTVYYVGVDPGHAGKGHGRTIMAAAEAWLKARGVWKLNLLVRSGNGRAVGFYRALGYDLEERVAMAKWLDESRRP